MNYEKLKKEWSQEVDNEMPMVFIVDGAEQIASWWIGKIDQAVAEEKARLRAEIKNGVGYGKFGFSRTDKGHEGEIAINIDNLLAYLDKPTTL